MYSLMESLFRYTLKNEYVDPPDFEPYLILVCFAKSSALLTGDSILPAVRNAAKLAV